MVLAYFLSPEELGQYGLFVATVGYALYVIGFEFYLFSSREIIKNGKEKGGKLIKNQLSLYGLSYLFLMPLFLFVFHFGYIKWQYLLIFLLLVILEHLAQEMNRLIVALSSQIWASIILFLRSGLWSGIIVLIIWLVPSTRNIETLFTAWTVGSLSACLVGFYWIYKNGLRGWREAVDWSWIKQGIKVSIPFFLATLITQGMFTFDRYLLDHFFSKEILGAYVLYISFVFSIVTFLEAGVFVFFYPKLIELGQAKKMSEFKEVLGKMTKQVLLIASISAVFAIIVIEPILKLIGKEIYIQNVNIFYCLLGAIWLQIVGMIPQYGLYALQKDKPIVVSHVLAAVLFFVLAGILSYQQVTLGIPLALCAAFSFSLVYKTVAYKS